MDFCKESDKYISLYIDETLDDKSRIAFLKHVEECSECARKLKEISYFTELCREDQDIPLPDNFSKSLHNRLLEASEKENKSKFVLFVQNKKTIASLSTAAVLVISLLMYNLLPQMGIKDEATNISKEIAQDLAGSAVDSSQSAMKIDRNLQKSKEIGSEADSTMPNATMSVDTNIDVLFNKDTAYVVDDNYKKDMKESTIASNNGSPEERKIQDESAIAITAIRDQEYFLNYAELNLKVSSKGSEIEMLKKFMMECGAIEKKTAIVNSIIMNSGIVEVPVDNSQYCDYYMPITLYNNFEAKAKEYNLELTFNSGIIVKDVTSIYNNLNTQINAINKKIEEALLRGKDIITLEIEKVRLDNQIMEIITGKEMITVRIFYIQN